MNTALSKPVSQPSLPTAKLCDSDTGQADARFVRLDAHVRQPLDNAQLTSRTVLRLQRPENLRLQIINYHQTEESASRASLHTLTHGEFERQLDLIVSHRLTVIPAADLTDHIGLHGGQALAITFDDGCKSDLTNAEKLLRRGLTATFFISSANIGQPGYLDADEIRELRGLGMSVGSHSHDHVRLTTLPRQVMIDQVAQSKAILEDVLGETVDRFAFPGGAYTPHEVRAVGQAGFRFAFGTDWGLNTDIPALGGHVIKRNNVIHGTPDIDFLTLVTLRHTHWRLFVFQAKRLLQTSLPDDLYRCLRDLLIRR